MNLTQTELGEGLGEDLKSVFEVFQIALLTLLNQGTIYTCRPSRIC